MGPSDLEGVVDRLLVGDVAADDRRFPAVIDIGKCQPQVHLGELVLLVQR